MLKEVKTRYIKNCAKCGREIKVGWTAYFNPDTKELFCKPCGQIINKENPESVTKSEGTASDSQFDMLLDMLSKQSEQLSIASIALCLLREQIDGILNPIPEPKKSTKSK